MNATKKLQAELSTLQTALGELNRVEGLARKRATAREEAMELCRLSITRVRRAMSAWNREEI